MDQELQRLIARDRDRRLDRLERDVWQRERDVLAAKATSRRLMSWQGAVLALAVLSSASLGMTAARAMAAPEVSWLGDSARLAPTTLLFGGHP